MVGRRPVANSVNLMARKTPFHTENQVFWRHDGGRVNPLRGCRG